MVKEYSISKSLVFAVLQDGSFRRWLEVPLTSEPVTLEALEEFHKEAIALTQEKLEWAEVPFADKNSYGVGIFLGGRAVASRMRFKGASVVTSPLSRFGDFDLELLLAFVENYRKIIVAGGQSPELVVSSVDVLRSYLGLDRGLSCNSAPLPDDYYDAEDEDVQVPGRVVASLFGGRMVFN